MPPSSPGRLAGAFLAALLAGAPAARAEDAGPLYDKGVRLYRDGRLQEAAEAFVQVRERTPDYREVNAYLQRCAGALKEQEDRRRRESAVGQARDLLAARVRAVRSLREVDGVRVQEEGVRTEILIPLGRLFRGEDPETSPASAAMMETLKDFVTTFHTPHLVVSWPLDPDDAPDAARLGARRAVGLGFQFLKRCGLAPERLFVRSRRDPLKRIRILISTLRPGPEDLDREFLPVMVHAARREVTPGGAPLSLDVILLDPARVKRWKLFILTPAGEIAWQYEGGQDLYAAVSWDALDAEGRPAAPGLYQAFLSAETWSAQVRTDTIALAVRPPPPTAKPRLPAPKKEVPRPRPRGQDVAKWFHVVVFDPGSDEIPGPMALTVEQAARALTLYRDRQVAVEGFAAPDEAGGRALAERRAERVRQALVQKHGVAADRILAKGNPPRAPLAGEVLHKVMIFFLER